MSYFSEVTADTPSAYLRLNETSGAVAADSSGSGNTGTYVGTPALGVAGLIYGDTDTAMQTSGNQQLTLPYIFGTNTFTIELWWKWTADGTADAIWRDNTSAGGTGYFIGVSSTGVNVRIAGTSRTPASTTNYRDGLRHHFALTYDGTTATLYVDGGQLDQWVQSSATLPASPMHIGYNGTNGGQYQPGVYDEVALYNYVLSSTRVSAHYAASGTSPSYAQVEALYLDALTTGSAAAQVEANYLEAMASGTPHLQVEGTYIEAMALVQPAQVESVYLESILMTTPTVNVEATYLEVILQGSPGPIPFKGWGSPV